MKTYIKLSVIIFGITFFVIGIILFVYYVFIKNKNKNKGVFSYSTKLEIPKYIIPKENNTEELVIAMCNEDVTWVDKYAYKYKLITIYNKCGRVVNFNSPNVKVIESPNIGTCDHAYLSYIIDRYDDLPDFIEFTKGWREPKKEYHNCLLCNNDNELYNKIMNFKLNNHQFGHILNRNKDYVWHKSGYKNMAEWIENNDFLDKELYKRNICNIIYGGQFGSTKEQIQKTSKEIWEKIRSQQKYTNEEVDHFIERSWRVLLCRPKYKLVIVAIFKNEAIAMREWLEHYIRQGVEHFYMIDNGSTDDWKSQVEGFPVTIYTDNEKHKQTEHYNDYFLEEVKRISEWVMVVDLDEFMYARNEFLTIPEYLDTLPKYIEELSVKWKMFGSNGHIEQPKSIIHGFTMRDKKIDNNVKSICRTMNLLKLGIHTHSIENKNNKIILEVNSEIMLRNSPLHLNHYAIQSWEFFKNIKMKRGAADSELSENIRDKEYFDKYDTNDIDDNELSKNTRIIEYTNILTNAPQKSIHNNTLVLYVFHKYNERVEYFIKNALFQDSNVDFVFMCNDPTFDISSKVPSYVTTFNRKNKGFDFGAWSDLLIKYKYAYKHYNTYIFVNSSVKGPFMNNYIGEKWTDILKNGLSDDIQLYGITINTCNDPLNKSHVQSYLFSMKQDMVHKLIEDGLFSEIYVDTFNEAINDKEIKMSRLVLNRGGNLGCVHTYYKNVDWRFNKKQPHEYNIKFLDDIMYPKFHNKLWTCDELIFIKGNRVSV